MLSFAVTTKMVFTPLKVDTLGSWLLSLMEPDDIDTHQNSWSWIWNLQVSEKYKFFIWLACHDAVPTLFLLHHRHITISTTCVRCDEAEETFMHCIRDCRFSCTIWQKLGFTNQDFFTTNCAHDWLKTGTKGPRSSLSNTRSERVINVLITWPS